MYNQYDELWGDFSLSVGNSGPITYYFTRFMPHAYEITTSQDSISYGDEIIVTVNVKNPSALSRSVRVRIIIDRNQGVDWDHESGTKQTSIASGGTASFDFSWIPDGGGTYYVWTIVETYLTGPAKWQLTDHWEWSPWFTVVMPGHLCVKLTSYDDDYHAVNVYVDNELWGFVDSHPDQTTFSSWRDVEPNMNHIVKIVWHDDDTGANYEKSSTKYVASDQYVEYPFTVDLHTGWVTVTGHIYYADDQGQQKPADGTLVELYDEDWDFDDLLGSTYTTSDGYFIFWRKENIDNELGESGTRDLYVKVKATNWAVNVVSPGVLGSTYEFRTVTFPDVPDGEDDWVVSSPSALDGVFNILSVLTKGNRYVDQFDDPPPQVLATWPDDDDATSEYDGPPNRLYQGIYLEGPNSATVNPEPDEFSDEVILHEYGHFVMDKMAELPSFTQGDDRHFWIEGWAQFFQAPIRQHLGYPNPEVYPETGSNLETWRTIQDEYMTVGSILWDIYDQTDDDQDTDGVGDELFMGFDEIWNVLVHYDPDPGDSTHNNPWTVHEFWDGWFAQGHGHLREMWALFYEHGIDKDTLVPEVEILSPLDGAIMATSTIEVNWIGSDDISGIDHYEIRLDSGSWIDVGLATSYVFSGVIEDFHIVEVKAIDRAGRQNTDSHSFTVVLLDGEITNYVVLTPTVIAGEKLRVEVTVENIGAIRAEYNVYIGNIWDSDGNNAGNAYSESHQIIQLDPGKSQTLTLEWTTPGAMLSADYSGDLWLQMAKPGGGWEKHKEYPNAISFTVVLEFLVSLSSRSTAGVTNIGSIDFDYQTYDLPNTISKEEGIYEVTANPPDGYDFDSWEYSGSISVSSSTSHIISVTVWGVCSLTAIFEGTLAALDVSAVIVEPPVLRETVGLGLIIRNTGTTQLEEGLYFVTISFWDYPEEGGLDSFGVKFIHHHPIQLGPSQPIAIEVPLLAPGQEYTPQTLRFSVLDRQQPTLILTDTIDVVVAGYGVTASTQIKDVDVLPGLGTFCDAILAIVLQVIPIKDAEIKLAIDLGLPVFQARIENAQEEFSNAIAAANEGDVAKMAGHFAKMGIYMNGWTTLLSPEEQYDFLVDLLWAFVDGGFSIANLLIFWVNFKYETYLAGFDLLSLSFIQAIGRMLGLSLITDPTNILVIDPLGRRSGFDYQTGLVLNEIPGAILYGLHGDVEAVFIPELIEGEYEIYCAGLTDGSFGLHVEGANGTSVVCDIVYSGTISEGEILDSDVTVTQTDEGVGITSSEPTPLGQAYTDKEEYEVGETVLLSFQNIGEIPITLNNTAPWIILDDSKSIVYRAVGVMTSVVVNPGEIKEWQWNQMDDFGNQVFPGIYLFRIYTSDGNYTARFSIPDITPPTIQIVSPQNTTYTVNDVDLIVIINEPTFWMGYSLDGQANVTITGNTVLTNVGEDSHHIIVYANDTHGNMGFSNIVYFTIDTPAEGFFVDGFESGSFSAWGGISTSSGEVADVVGSLPHHGSYGGLFTSNGDGTRETAYSYVDVGGLSELYVRGYFYVSQSGISANQDRFYFIRLRAGGINVAYAGWRMIGGEVRWSLTIRDGTGWPTAYSESIPLEDTWYCVELHWVEDAVNGLGELYVDGVLVCSIEGVNTASFGGSSEVCFGLAEAYSCTATVYGDCCVISDAYVGEEP